MTEIFMMPAGLVGEDRCPIITSEVASAVNVELPSRQNAMLPAVTSMGGWQDIVSFDVAAALRCLTVLMINEGRNNTVRLQMFEKTGFVSAFRRGWQPLVRPN